MLTMLVRDLCLEDADLVFDDPARGVVRRILRRGAGIAAYLLAGDVRASEALLNWADTGITPGNIGQVLLGRSPSMARAQVICSCMNVSDVAIQAAIDAGSDLAALKATLTCGVTCGSCLPQIKRMFQTKPIHEAPL